MQEHLIITNLQQIPGCIRNSRQCCIQPRGTASLAAAKSTSNVAHIVFRCGDHPRSTWPLTRVMESIVCTQYMDMTDSPTGCRPAQEQTPIGYIIPNSTVALAAVSVTLVEDPRPRTLRRRTRYHARKSVTGDERVVSCRCCDCRAIWNSQLADYRT
jgi:hypothetical protein